MVTRTPPIPESSTHLRLEYRNPRELKANTKNWRLHPRRQRQAYNALKEKVGYAGAPLLNETTGNLLDGHMRVDEAIKAGEAAIPVNIGSWTEEQEDLILEHLDPIAALAGTNREALESLQAANRKKLTDLTQDHNRRLQQLSNDMAARAENSPLIQQSKSLRKPPEKPQIELVEDAEEAAPGEIAYEPPANKRSVRREVIEGEVFFPGTTSVVGLPLQLPELDSSMLATPDMAPTNVFDRSKGQERTETTYYCIGANPYPEDRQGGILGFFTEDYRFNGAYDFAENFIDELLEEDWLALVGPDFSTYDEWPLPLRLFSVYKNRWCSRYWQEAGFYVIPSIQYFSINGSVDLTMKVCVETLPNPCPVLACQMRSNEDLQGTVALLNKAVDYLQVEKLVIYGGDEKKKYIHGYMTDRCEVVYLTSFIASRRKLLKATR